MNLKTVLITAGAVVVLGGAAFAMFRPGFDLSWTTTPDAGGVTFAGGGSYELGATVAQVDANVPFTMEGGNYTLNAGFWPGATQIQFCRGDVDDDRDVDFQDLLLLLSEWGLCPDPPTKCPTDIDNDGETDFQDLLALLANWGCRFGSDGAQAPGDTLDDLLTDAGLSALAWDQFLDVLELGSWEEQERYRCWMLERLVPLDETDFYRVDGDCPDTDPFGGGGN